jgi:hypothetical protein
MWEREEELNGSEQRPVYGSCEHCNVSSDSKKGGQFLAQLNDNQLLREASAYVEEVTRHRDCWIIP